MGTIKHKYPPDDECRTRNLKDGAAQVAGIDSDETVVISPTNPPDVTP